ncbi:MAG: YjgP/YjgQ family permease [Flavobacteriaceae bacterium]|nr:YjgP/YjgQ family permease [Flavobacteriaceae bacterium]
MIKILDRYLLTTFLSRFLSTFIIILFVLVMQAIWWAFDDIAGKGIDFMFILKYFWYISLLGTSTAMPIAILLASIMTLGAYSENYEYAASKSSGISFSRMVRPLVIFAILLSSLNFLFLNYVFPYASLKSINLHHNMRKKTPSLALSAGSFNSEIPGYTIKFDEKYGANDDKLKNVLIYKIEKNKGNSNIITANRGRLYSEENSNYLKLILYDGYHYNEPIADKRKDRKKALESEAKPMAYTKFYKYTVNIDVSTFNSDGLDDEKHTDKSTMLTIAQASDKVKKLKIEYDKFLLGIKKPAKLNPGADKLHSHDEVYKSMEYFRENKNYRALYGVPNDTVNVLSRNTDILANYNIDEQYEIIERAVSTASTTKNKVSNYKANLKRKRKSLNSYDLQFFTRIAGSLSCLLLFFIGAPLGSIIKKGGFGLPMVLAIMIFVFYYFTNEFGKNLASESKITVILGGWFSTIIMLPVALMLTYIAYTDKSIFNFKGVFDSLLRLIKSKK